MPLSALKINNILTGTANCKVSMPLYSKAIFVNKLFKYLKYLNNLFTKIALL